MSIPLRKPASLALGALMAGGLSAPTFAMTDLAQGYALSATASTHSTPPAKQDDTASDKTTDAGAGTPKQKAEGKCGEGRCGSKHASDKPKAADKDKAGDSDKQHAEGKCGEGKCGGAA